MMQGDQYKLPLFIENEDGSSLDEKDVQELEIMFSSGVRKTLSDGGVSYDTENKCFNIKLTQKETFMMRGNVKITARVKFHSGDVLGEQLEPQNVAESISKVVL